MKCVKPGIGPYIRKCILRLTICLATYAILWQACQVYATGLALPVHGTGKLAAVAGLSGSGYYGDGVPLSDAKFGQIEDVTIDMEGSIFLCDADIPAGGSFIRMISAVNGTFYGTDMKAGYIYTLTTFGYIGGSRADKDLAVDSKGNLYIADSDGNCIYRLDRGSGSRSRAAGTGSPGFSGDGGLAVSAKLNKPYCVAVDKNDNLYIADYDNKCIRRVGSDGVITTIAGGGASKEDGEPATGAKITPSIIEVDGAGNIFIGTGRYVRIIASADGELYGINMKAGCVYTVAGKTTGLGGYAGDGGPATNAVMGSVGDIRVDGGGNLYIRTADADTGSFVRKVDPGSGIISTAAGSIGGAAPADSLPATNVSFPSMFSLMADSDGNLYIVYGSTIYYVQIAPPKLNTLNLNGSPELAYCGVPLVYDLGRLTLDGKDQNGDIYDIGSQTVTWTVYDGPASVTGSALCITGSGTVTVAASACGVLSNLFDITVKSQTEGPKLFAVAGTSGSGYYGDGVPLGDARFGQIEDMTVDVNGSLFLCDISLTNVGEDGMFIRMVSAVNGKFYGIDMKAGYIYTLAAFSYIKGSLITKGLAVDSKGNLYITDSDSSCVYKLDRDSGNSTVVAGNGNPGFSGDGGAATSARLNEPVCVAVDKNDNLYIGDYGNRRIRKVDSNGIITTVAGGGEIQKEAGVPATEARIFPVWICVDDYGNVFTSGIYYVQMIAAANGTYYGIDMKAGHIYTIAGQTTGLGGYSGDGGPAAKAMIGRVGDIRVDGGGNLYIKTSDAANDSLYACSVVRKIAPDGIITTAVGNMREVATDGTDVTIIGGTAPADGLPAEGVTFPGITSLLLDNEGNLYVGYFNTLYYVQMVMPAPQLKADTVDNTAGQAVDIAFDDDADWREAIRDITVNGASIAGKYTVSAGNITIDGGIFGVTGNYTVTVKAEGYRDTSVSQVITRGCAYIVTPFADEATYVAGTTSDGISTMTVRTGVSGIKYFGVKVSQLTEHEGMETIVFVHLRDGVQIELNAVGADFDVVGNAQAGFNVKGGDVVKAYMVDALDNAADRNPVVLGQPD